MQEVTVQHSNPVVDFFHFWYVRVGGRIVRHGIEFLETANHHLAPIPMLKMLFTPLFGDYSWTGYVLGFLFRSVRAIVGGLVLVVLSVTGVAIWITWSLIPIAVFTMAVANLVFLFFG